MTRRRALPSSDASDTDVGGLTFYERYRQEAMASHTVDSFYVHLNAKGEPWLLTMGSSELPTREQMIESYQMVEHVIVLGSWPDQTRFSYTPSREEAEQQVELLEGVWPTTRMLCASSSNAVTWLDERFTPNRTSKPPNVSLLLRSRGRGSPFWK